jgi:hypothetical protein
MAADNIDAGENARDVFNHLGIAMVEIAEQRYPNNPNTNYGDFMVRRAQDIRDATGIVDEDDFDQLALALDAAINGAHQVVLGNVINERSRRIANADNRHEAIAIAFEPTHTSDSQNVHERGVLEDTRKVIDNLRKSKPKYPVKKCINECDELCKKYFEGTKLRDARTAMSKLNERGSIFALAETEDEIFALVWSRSFHENNEESAQLIREAICDALYDCVDHETGKPVCITGRATRIVSALATLDFEDEGIMTHEMKQNELFEECKRLIETRMTSGQVDDDKIIARGAVLYENDDDPNNADDVVALSAFKRDLKSRIINIINDSDIGNKPEMIKKCLLFADIQE